MEEKYFKFNLYGDNWGDIVQTGKYIFQNVGNKIGVHKSLPFIVFHYVANYNLDDLELFFRLAGFSAFTEDELPDSIVRPININLTNKNNVHSGLFGGFTNEEEAKRYIEIELGENVISKFNNIKEKRSLCKRANLLSSLQAINLKKKQLLHERASLLASLQAINEDLGDRKSVV